ncbi:MAG: C25 family cysteine peptidase [Anaerolineales bacterium]|nr:C25 family cysteine peptidase [Anaerolineales bacterium]
MVTVSSRRNSLCVTLCLSLIFWANSPISSAKASSHLAVVHPPAASSIQPITTIAPSSAADALHIEENEYGLTFELVTPNYTLRDRQLPNSVCQELNVEGFAPQAIPGWPNLPTRGVLIGIPPDSQPRLTILETETVDLPEKVNLCPVPQLLTEQDESGEIQDAGEKIAPDPAVYASHSFLPADPAELVILGFLRSQRVAQVRFQPFQYNPAEGRLRIYSRIRLQVDYGLSKTSLPPATTQVDEGAFEPFLESSLVNYTAASRWRTHLETQSKPQAATDIFSGQEWVKITTDQEGMVRITRDDLLSAGLNVSVIDPRTMQVFSRGEEIAVWVTGESDGVFDAGDQLIFFASPINTRYTTTNVYWLTWGQTVGLRMATINGTPLTGTPIETYFATQHAEQNLLYYSNRPNNDGDVWYWKLINAASAPAYVDLSLNLSQVDITAPISATLRGELRGNGATPQHHTRLYVNGHLVHDATWASFGELDFEVSFPMGWLQEGANNIRVECPRDGGITQEWVLVNWVEIGYQRHLIAEQDRLIFSGGSGENQRYILRGFSSPTVDVFDITSAKSPRRMDGVYSSPDGDAFTVEFTQSSPTSQRYQALTQEQYLRPTSVARSVSANLRSPENGADYIIITHQDFAEAIQPLADWHRGQGMRVRVVDVQDVYNEFNDGIFDPQAIRDFLAYAYENWQPPAPLYVLLVGDGNYDPRNYKGFGEPNYIPPYLAQYDYFLGESAADNRYVTVHGDDLLPDMLIGRLPVKTAAETAAVVAKILAYSQTPSLGSWNSQILFVADNADSGGNFPYYSDLLINNYLPTGYNAERIYYQVTHSSVSEAQNAIRQSINQGKLIVNFVGHGGVQQWASENLLNNAAVASLNNAGKLPLFASLTCLTGFFHNPSPPGQDYSSLAETLIKAADRGAIAVWASTGMGFASGQDYLNRGLYDAIFFKGEERLGAAALQAKLYLYNNTTGYQDLLDAFHLFGDPALALNVQPADLAVELEVQPTSVVAPGEAITYTLTYANQGVVMAADVSLEFSIPAQITITRTTALPDAPVSQTNDQITWEVGNLDPGEGGVITVNGTIKSGAVGQINSQAMISSTTPEEDLDNNTSGPVQLWVANPSAVLLSSPVARPYLLAVEVSWQTGNELGVHGFNIYRSLSPDGDKTLLNPQPIPSLLGSQVGGASYSYLDNTATPGVTCYYWVEVLSDFGAALFESSPVRVNSSTFIPLVVRSSP